MIEKKIDWFKEMLELCSKHNFDAVNIYNQFLEVLKIDFQNSLISKKGQASFYKINKQLEVQLTNNH